MAATDGGRCIRNAPYRLSFQITDQQGNQIPSWENDGAPFSNMSKDTAALTTGPVPTMVDIGDENAASFGYVDLTEAQMTFSYEMIIEVDATGQSTPSTFVLKGEPCLDSGVVVSTPTSTSLKLRASASSINDTYNGATIEIVRGTGAGQVRTITDYAGSGSQTVTVDRLWITSPSATSVYIIHPQIASSHATVGNPDVNVTSLQGETTALTVMTELYNGAIKSLVGSGTTPSTTTFTGDSNLSSTADFYNRCFLVFTTGTLQGLMRPISDYSSARLITFDATDAWPPTPAINDEFVILSYRSQGVACFSSSIRAASSRTSSRCLRGFPLLRRRP